MALASVDPDTRSSRLRDRLRPLPLRQQCWQLGGVSLATALIAGCGYGLLGASAQWVIEALAGWQPFVRALTQELGIAASPTPLPMLLVTHSTYGFGAGLFCGAAIGSSFLAAPAAEPPSWRAMIGIALAIAAIFIIVFPLLFAGLGGGWYIADHVPCARPMRGWGVALVAGIGILIWGIRRRLRGSAPHTSPHDAPEVLIWWVFWVNLGFTVAMLILGWLRC